MVAIATVIGNCCKSCCTSAAYTVSCGPVPRSFTPTSMGKPNRSHPKRGGGGGGDWGRGAWPSYLEYQMAIREFN